MLVGVLGGPLGVLLGTSTGMLRRRRAADHADDQDIALAAISGRSQPGHTVLVAEVGEAPPRSSTAQRPSWVAPSPGVPPRTSTTRSSPPRPPRTRPTRGPAGAARPAARRAQGQVGAVQEQGQVVAELTPSRPRFLILGGAPRRRVRAEQAWPRPLGRTVGPARSPRSGAGRDVRPRPPGCTDSPAGQEYPQRARPRNTGDGQIQQHGLGVDAYRQPRRRSGKGDTRRVPADDPFIRRAAPGPGDRGEGARAGPVAAAGRSSGRDPTEQPGGQRRRLPKLSPDTPDTPDIPDTLPQAPEEPMPDDPADPEQLPAVP